MTDNSAKKDHLPAAARRALAEAEARRAAKPAPDSPPGRPPGSPPDSPVELGGRKGPEPTRFGDWEKNGIVSDF
jgi:hypothetical protein